MAADDKPLQSAAIPSETPLVDALDEFFKGAVRGLIGDLQVALREWRISGNASELRRHCHSLKGSGGSFGFPLISVLAAAAEEAEPAELERAVEMLVAELESIATDPDRQHVLVVDDDRLVAGLLEHRLSGPERRVTVAHDLAEARRAIQRDRYDLVILDLLLPDGDGRAFLDELGASAASAAVPVIVLSGSESPELRADCLTRGAEGFVTKPFLPDALSHLVATILADSRDGMAGRGDFVDIFRRTAAEIGSVTVAAVVTETHGPGGRSSEAPDPATLPIVEAVISEVAGPDVTLTRWGQAELALLSREDTLTVADALNRARLRLRTMPHPEMEGAITSFSAGVITELGDRGLVAALSQARRMASQAHAHGGDRVAAPGVSLSANRVLFAEDDTLTAALVVTRLEREGYLVEHYTNGLEAVAAFDREPYDLVVLDVQMPGMTGLDVLGHIRRSNRPRVPVVILSAVGGERDVVNGFELGADDYILKPFSPAELTARVKRFTNSHS